MQAPVRLERSRDGASALRATPVVACRLALAAAGSTGASSLRSRHAAGSRRQGPRRKGGRQKRAPAKRTQRQEAAGAQA